MLVTGVSKKKWRRGWTVYMYDIIKDSDGNIIEGTLVTKQIYTIPEFLYYKARIKHIKRIKND